MSSSNRSAGFSYVGLMIVIAIISLIAATSVQFGAIMHRRAAEAELIFVGLQYKQAIRSYFESAPRGSQSTPPRRLEDLLRDPRFPNIKRHLRQLFPDPMTGKMDWVIIYAPDGKGILGVHSRSKETPIKMDNFPDDVFYFKNKKSYAQWVFVYGVVCTEAGCEIDSNTNPNPDNNHTQ